MTAAALAAYSAPNGSRFDRLIHHVCRLDPTRISDPDHLQGFSVTSPAEATLDRISALLRNGLETGRSQGYLDVLPPPPKREATLAQAAMNNRLVTAVYEGPWRQGGLFLLTGGMTTGEEQQKALRDMRCEEEQLILDVACGPGNFTKFLSDSLVGDGLVIGLDVSAPMLRRAAKRNSRTRAGYLRADARDLPFEDNLFDAVCCFAALYLVPEPEKVLAELMRVVKPGGRLCLMTSCTRGQGRLQLILSKATALSGIRTFARDSVTTLLRDNGFVDVNQDVRGLAQFVQATKGATGGDFLR